ncbi:MAG: trypsin-like peptidase domain-containing protein [Deltaproteobacteria bacterium]|nr:trypsin-like peptidase domain-containing protein [Deltaproteobacteria bacterium]
MIRFRQVFGAHAGRLSAFEQDIVRFGRLPTSDVAFDPLADIDASARHAEVRRDGTSYVLVDVGSRNGTLVNGTRVTSHVLRDGDEIEFGDGGPRFRVELDGEHPTVDLPQSEPPPAPGMTAPAWVPGAQAQAPVSGFAMPPAAAVPSFPPADVGFHPSVPTPVPPQTPQTAPPPSEKRYGQGTVEMIVQQAVERTRQERPPARTDFIRAVATDAAKKSARGLKVVLALVTILLLAAVAGLVLLVIYIRDDTRGSREEIVRLQAELDRLEDKPDESAAVRQRIEALNQQLERQTGRGRSIVQSAGPTVFLLASRSTTGQRTPLCTGFAVRPDLLATNAHCVLSMEQHASRGAVFEALQNGTGVRLSVARMWRHPGYRTEVTTPSADVGIVQLHGQAPTLARLATMQELAALQPGDDVYVFGFPGDLPDGATPVATFTNGVVGRMTAFDGSAAPFASQHLLQHSAFTAPGTSGSPIFSEHGVVVAINAGSYRGAQQTTVVDPNTGQRRPIRVVADTGYKIGVRVDLLLQLLLGMGR